MAVDRPMTPPPSTTMCDMLEGWWWLERKRMSDVEREENESPAKVRRTPRRRKPRTFEPLTFSFTPSSWLALSPPPHKTMSIDNAASTSGGAAEDSCVAWHSIPPRTLIIDHHDSYTLNLLPLLLHALAPEGATPTRADAALLSSRLLVLPHTHALLEPCAFAKHLAPHLDALLLSPGPGSPEREADFGVAAKLIRAGARGSDLPTLGVCLGHQGIATALGGSVKRASGIRHGVTSSLRWSAEGEQRDGEGMLQDVPEGAQVVRYNSLTVDESSE